MSKITSQPIHRLHITLFQSEYDQLRSISKEVKSPISKVLRELIRELLSVKQQIIIREKLKALEEIEYD
jgi:hypothetical protein